MLTLVYRVINSRARGEIPGRRMKTRRMKT